MIGLAPQPQRIKSADAVAKPHAAARVAGYSGNQARLRRLTVGEQPLQAKLTIGATNDPLEHEADAAADLVMRMADPKIALSPAAATLSRKCAACEKEEEKPLMREAVASDMAGEAAPMVVDSVLGAPGRPLDPLTQEFMASRFGADFSDVRVHTGAQAAQSAAEVGARAYTVGSNVVFGSGQYDPASEDGRRLLAHELAHTLQQGGGALKRAPCRSTSECATAAPGDTANFVVGIAPVQAANAAALAAAPPASPQAAQRALIGAPTPDIGRLMAANGVVLRPEVFGIFQSPAIEGNAGAQTQRCSNFPNGSPAGAALRTNPAAAGKSCIEVPPSLEVRAGPLVGVAPPGTAAQRAERARVLSVIAHEMEHAHFDTTQAATIAPTGDCDINTIVRPNPDPTFDAFRVKFFLSEIAAISNQFPTYFDNFMANDNPGDHRLLFDDERNEAFNRKEGIVGSIRGLQCACSCPSVNALVTQTINLAMADWTPAQQLAFRRAMTRIMPSFWPPALRAADAP